MSIIENGQMTVNAVNTADNIPTVSIQQTEAPVRTTEVGPLVYDQATNQYKRVSDATNPLAFPVVDAVGNAVLANILTKLADPATQATLAAVLAQLQSGVTPVTVNGRKAGVAVGSFDQTLNVAAGGSAIITITPTAGELWRIKMLRLYVPVPSGATSGSHGTVVGVGTPGVDYSSLQITSLYNKGIAITNNVINASDDSKPFDEMSQILAITNIVLTNAQPLKIYYNNNTNAAQTENMALRVTREVEYIA
jgi:hypothetical protein